MSRDPEIFTSAIMTQVRTLVALGLTGTEIAKRIGCEPASLRSACAKHGIALRRVKIDLSSLEIKLSPEVTSHLRREAARRGIPDDVLAAEIIDAVINDRLFSAVLDK